jgi:MerR family transcriptional regulator, light-induced transcriptional regulator
MDPAVEPADAGDRTLYRRYWQALYRRDVRRAEQIVELCLRDWKPERIYLRLFEPALNLSGKLWAAGAITYRDEHFVTYHTLRFLRRARRKLVPAETTGPLALATAAGQESHLIGLRMVCDFLQADNWRIHWLASNDRSTVRQAVRDFQAGALLISIGLDLGLPPARRVIADARAAGFKGLAVVGGAAINRDLNRVQAIGADLTAPNGFLLRRLLRQRGIGRSSA